MTTAAGAGGSQESVQTSALAKNLRARRLALGLSQEALAVYAGVTRSTVMRIELDSPFRPRLDSLDKLAAYLQCRVVDLLSDDPDDDGPIERTG